MRPPAAHYSRCHRIGHVHLTVHRVYAFNIRLRCIWHVRGARATLVLQWMPTQKTISVLVHPLSPFHSPFSIDAASTRVWCVCVSIEEHTQDREFFLFFFFFSFHPLSMRRFFFCFRSVAFHRTLHELLDYRQVHIFRDEILFPEKLRRWRWTNRTYAWTTSTATCWWCLTHYTFRWRRRCSEKNNSYRNERRKTVFFLSSMFRRRAQMSRRGHAQ